MPPPGIKVKGEFAIVGFDMRKFTNSLSKSVKVQNRQAVRAWLKAVLPEVPGYTQTARGTFAPVGRLVNRAVKRIPTLGDPKRAKKKKFAEYNSRKYRTGFTYGSIYANAKVISIVSRSGVRNIFVHTNNLPYVAWNDINNAPPGFKMPSNPPWRFKEKGRKAWEDYINTEAKRKLPKVREHIKITKNKVG